MMSGTNVLFQSGLRLLTRLEEHVSAALKVVVYAR